MNKVLFIAYQIPPVSGAATQRHLRFLNNLEGLGWFPVILTGDEKGYADYYSFDNELINRMPMHLTIHRARCYSLFEALLKRKNSGSSSGGKKKDTMEEIGRGSKFSHIKDVISDVFRVPDQQNGWFIFSIMKGFRLIRKENVDIIYASGGPWTSFLIGAVLSYVFKIPLICDFRDPWIGNPYKKKKNQFVDSLEKRLEKFVVKKSSFIIANTKNLLKMFRDKYPSKGQSFVHISNGYLSKMFMHFKGDVKKGSGKKFIVSHVGSLYAERSPDELFQVIARMKSEGSVSSDSFLLQLVGVAEQFDELMKRIKESGIEDLVRLVGHVPHKQALEFIHSSDIVLVFQQGTDLQIPGKLFEYMAMKKPILAIAGHGATKDIIEQEKLGIVSPPGDLRKLERALSEYLAKHKAGELSKMMDAVEIESYESVPLTEKLVKLMHDCTINRRC